MRRIALLWLCWALCAFNSTPLLSQSPPRLIGTLEAVKVVPNRPGTRCGNHYELGVATADGKIVVVSVYDMSASVKDINAMRGKKVEIDLAGKAVLGIRLSGEQNAKISALSGLSTRAPC